MPDVGETWAESASETVSGRLTALAGRFGDRIALSDLGGELTFSEVIGRMDAIAGEVETVPCRAGGPIAVLAPLDHRFYLAFLGVLRAGRIALVLDPEHPRGRLRLIAERAGAEAILTTEALAGDARALVPSGCGSATGRRPAATADSTVSRGVPEGTNALASPASASVVRIASAPARSAISRSLPRGCSGSSARAMRPARSTPRKAR